MDKSLFKDNKTTDFGQRKDDVIDYDDFDLESGTAHIKDNIMMPRF
jgi:hypothetical protein